MSVMQYTIHGGIQHFSWILKWFEIDQGTEHFNFWTSKPIPCQSPCSLLYQREYEIRVLEELKHPTLLRISTIGYHFGAGIDAINVKISKLYILDNNEELDPWKIMFFLSLQYQLYGCQGEISFKLLQTTLHPETNLTPHKVSHEDLDAQENNCINNNCKIASGR